MGPMKLTLLGGLSLLSISAYLQLASSQDAVCTASSEDGFDYQVQPRDDFVFHWTVNEQSEEISFQVEYEGTAYVSVGFSSNGQMVESDAVIGLPDDDSVLEYSLDDESIAGVNPTDDEELSGTSITQTEKNTVMTFTRPLAPSGSGKYTLVPEEGEEAIFIWALGPDNTLAHHSWRGSVSLTDILCSDTVTLEDDDEEEEDDDEEEEDDDEEEEDDDEEEGDEEDDDEQTELSPAGSECDSSDPEYEIEFSPTSDLTVFYSVDESTGTISVKAVYQGEAWLGIGFSDDEFMPQSDAVVGRPDDETALEYDMPSRSRPTEADVQEVTDATVSQVSGVTTLTFTRPLEPEDDRKQVLALASTTYWFYAWGEDPFREHDEKGAFSVTLGECGFDSAANSSTEEDAHGWLMALSWAFFFPMGIIFARFSPDFKTVGFKAHWMLQSVGALLAFAGFFTALYFTDDLEREHFDNNHAKVGLFLIIFVAFQLAGAVCRPASPTSPGVDVEGRVLPPVPKAARRVWAFSHRGLGYVAVVLGILNCFSGLEELEADDKWEAALAAVVVILVVVFVVLQVVALVGPRLKPTHSPERSRQPFQAEMS